MSSTFLDFTLEINSHFGKQEKLILGEIYYVKGVLYFNDIGGCPRGVMVKAMDCGIVVSEFILQLCYYVVRKWT